MVSAAMAGNGSRAAMTNKAVTIDVRIHSSCIAWNAMKYDF
jgi:hypothetical protein